jgi:uncharacterized protein (TIGR02466 family)
MVKKAKVVGEVDEFRVNTNELITPQVQLYASNYFCCGVYSLVEPKFLDTLRKISKFYLDDAKKKTKLDKIFPVVQGDNMPSDPRISDFVNFVSGAAHQVLASQGYNMTGLKVVYSEMWVQEHHTSSGHEEHIHGYGNQISGFYFLDTPKDGPRVIFHDPRPAKVYANLPETDVNQATLASNMINYVPEPGLMILTNSWLPHTIQRNTSKQPLRLIHFNLSVTNA